MTKHEDAVLEVSGPDAVSYLHKMTSNDVARLSVGEAHYNALLDRKGMILALFLLLHPTEDRLLLVMPEILKQKTLGLLQKMKFIQKVEVKDLSQELSHRMLAQDPQAANRKEALVWEDPFYRKPLWHWIGPHATAPAGIPENEMEILRLSSGIPKYGVDIDETHNLLEVQAPIAYARSKGCYPGQEVIERILAYGKGKVPKKICRLECEGKLEIAPQTRVSSKDGLGAGVISSSLYDPLERKTILLACLTHRYVEGAAWVHRKGDKIFLSE